MVPVGALDPFPVDVQFFAVTNLDPAMSARLGEPDPEYVRLAAVTLTVPPLRQRRSEIRPLAEIFVAEQRSADGRPPVEISSAVLEMLEAWIWPWNITELKLVSQRAAILCEDVAIGPELLPDRIARR